ncbi:S-formylglutathione hydrolase [Parvularcula sp. ZS-1/3]|uniref:S-formylglutathione hydrolase n=1 Tax=Parvularcula mediterranea TaxID=2732508 RepID=A0A7Y3RL37_9PROT|nr:S-formylglutathione hydrolase [Parvularcula mediterranea]NNU16082.1 S-formylglutathione hydrolase [Parvularcula mediterranea]
MQSVEKHRSHGGTLEVFDHESAVTGTTMRFAVFLPREAEKADVPCLWYLSGLTCNWSNVMEKGGVLKAAAARGCAIIAPDTSPRGEGVPDDEAYDLGQGAGFYLTATQEPWSQHFQMDRYITEELQALVTESFPIAKDRQGIFGHSMGGHGAISLHLKHPELYRTCSAFAPITAPSQCPWGQKAFTAYLGSDNASWAQYDSAILALKQPSEAEILIDQGLDDPFLSEQLLHGIFEDACQTSGQAYALRRQAGYDHSYYFISTFMDDHLRHHMEGLTA